MMEIKNCPFCNEELPENALFCIYCMHSLNQKKTYKTKNTAKKPILSILLAVAAVLVIGLIIIFAKNVINISPKSETADNGSVSTYAFDARYNGVVITNVAEIPKNGIYTVPSEIDGHRVVGIAAMSFLDNDVCSVLKSVILPESVLYVADYAFSNCFNLTELYFYNKNATISKRAFFGGAEYASLHFPHDAIESTEHTALCTWNCYHDLEYYIKNGFK